VSIEISPLRREDVPGVVCLLGILFAQEADFSPDAERQQHALHRLLDEPSLGVVLVARSAGAPVGTVMLLRTVSTAIGEEACWLEDFVVAPDHRGRGIGTELLAAALAEARRRGFARVTLLTDADNESAQRLYRRHGFVRSGMVPLRLAVGPSD
jgi:ribosomal protein S18 acetylase RimI-like enzyme